MLGNDDVSEYVADLRLSMIVHFKMCCQRAVTVDSFSRVRDRTGGELG